MLASLVADIPSDFANGVDDRMRSSVVEKARTRLANTIISVLSPKYMAIALLCQRHVPVVNGRAYGDRTAESVLPQSEEPLTFPRLY